MDSRKAEHLIPVLQDNFNPHTTGGQLQPNEIQLLVFIDGATTADGLAQLAGLEVVDVMARLEVMEQKGVIFFKQAQPAPKSGAFSSTSSHTAPNTPASGTPASYGAIPGLRTPSSSGLRTPSSSGLRTPSFDARKHAASEHPNSSFQEISGRAGGAFAGGSAQSQSPGGDVRDKTLPSSEAHPLPSQGGQPFAPASSRLSRHDKASPFSAPDSFDQSSSSSLSHVTPGMKGPSTETDIPLPDNIFPPDTRPHPSSKEEDLPVVSGAELSPSRSTLDYPEANTDPFFGEEFPLDEVTNQSAPSDWPEVTPSSPASGWPEPPVSRSQGSAPDWQVASRSQGSASGWQAASPSTAKGSASGWAASPSQGSAPGWQAASPSQGSASGWQTASPSSAKGAAPEWRVTSPAQGSASGWQAASPSQGSASDWPESAHGSALDWQTPAPDDDDPTGENPVVSDPFADDLDVSWEPPPSSSSPSFGDVWGEQEVGPSSSSAGFDAVRSFDSVSSSVPAAHSMDSMERAEATTLMKNHPATKRAQEVPVPAPSTHKQRVQEQAKKKAEEEKQTVWDENDELMSEDYIKMMVGDNVATNLSMEETRHAAQVLTAFVRVTSSFQLYDPRNDAVRDALVALFSTLTSFLKQYEVLSLSVEPWEFLYNGESIYRNKEREYSLAFKLFRDGVRGLSFRKGIPWPELAKFLRILGVRYHGVHMFEDDIVSLIWKANFDYIDTIAVEGFEESEDHFNPTAEAETFLARALEQKELEEETGEEKAYVWQTSSDMSEENMSVLIHKLKPGPVEYEPISHFKASLMQEEVDAEHLPHRVNRLIEYMQQEVCHPRFPMQSSALQNLVIEFRDYLLTEERLEDLTALFQRVKMWEHLGDADNLATNDEADLLDLAFGDEPLASPGTSISGNDALALIYREFLESFTEKRLLRRLLDASKLNEEGDDVMEETYTILSMLPIDPVPVLFELLEAESYQNLKTVMRFMLVRLTNKETNVFRKRLLGASPEFTIDLLYCMFMIKDQDAVEAIVSQISNPSPDVQQTVLKLIDRLISDSGEGMAVRDVIARLIESEDYDVRRRAYLLVEKSGDSRWATPLLRLFENDLTIEESEQKQIARLAALVNPGKAKKVFIELTRPPGRWALKGSWETPQRLAALAGLAIIGDPDSEDAIRAILRRLGKESDTVRIMCIAAMREIRRRQRGVSSDSLDLDLGSLASLDDLDTVFDLGTSLEQYSELKEAEAAARQAQAMAEEEARKEKEAELAQVSGAKEVDVSEIQQQMLKALQHSSGGHTDFSGQLRRYGYELVLLLHMLVKTSRLYDADNKIFEKPFDDIAAMMDRLLNELGEVALMGVDGSFYINDVRIRLQRDSAEIGEELFEDLARVGVGGMTFSIAMTADEWRTFIRLLVTFSQTEHGDTLTELKAELEQLGLKHHVDLVGELTYRIGEEENHVKIGQARSMLNAYVKANDATQSLWDSVAVGRIPNPLPVRHASNDFVDALNNKDQVNPLEVLSLGEYDNPLNAHVLDTTMYTLMIGREVGLSHIQLADLSMSAFFHDVGYAVNPELVNASVAALEKLPHSSIGMRFLARQQGFQDSKVKRLLTVMEHHMDAYNPEQQNSPSLFSRIIHVADTYSLLTAPLYKHQPKLSPTQALALLSGGKGSSFDPLLAQALINVLGKYPPSTLVQLNNGAVAISLGFSGEPAFFERPRVLVVRMPSGALCEGPTIDLSEPNYDDLHVQQVLPPDPEIPVKKIMARILRDRVRLEKQVF